MQSLSFRFRIQKCAKNVLSMITAFEKGKWNEKYVFVRFFLFLLRLLPHKYEWFRIVLASQCGLEALEQATCKGMQI